MSLKIMSPIFGLGLLAMTVSTPAQAKEAECLLVVKGVEHIRGTCEFTPLVGNGSFQIKAYNGKYLAEVILSDEGDAHGFWNETPYSVGISDGLGRLRRDDACWVNASAAICAW